MAGLVQPAALMGARNADRIPNSAFHGQASTVALLRANRWEVISHCYTCQLMMVVDLALVEMVSGPDVSLWNRKARCKRIGCPGHVQFEAKRPGRTIYEPMTVDLGPQERERPKWLTARGL